MTRDQKSAICAWACLIIGVLTYIANGDTVISSVWLAAAVIIGARL